MMRPSLPSILCCALFCTLSRGADLSTELLWKHPTGSLLPMATVLSSNGSHLFVALKTGGVAVLDIRNGKVREVSALRKGSFRQLEAMNLALDGNRLFVALGNFFGKSGFAGLAIVDVSNPGRPTVLSVWKSKEKIKGSAVVAVQGRYAYLGAMSHGLMIFDVSNPRAIRRQSTFQPDIHFPRRNPGPIQHPNARGMALRGNLLFLAYDAGGLRAIDIRNPKRPKEVGRYINARMKGKQQAYNNLVIDGSLAYIAIDYAGLEIVDVSNPRRMRLVGWWNPWKADTLQNLWFNSPGHTNQLVLDRRNKRVLLSAGDSELQVVDVSTVKRPRLLGSYGKPKNNLGVWGLTATSDRAYLAYIRTVIPFRGTWSGIQAISLK